MTDTQITVQAPSVMSDLKTGSSIAVDGCCLTVVDQTNDSFTADFMPETTKKTIMGQYQVGQLVNLERAMPANGRFEGHVVSGHVECIGEVIKIQQDGNAQLLTIQVADLLAKYMIPKGSITINGISLTVVDVDRNRFSVSIIPHTWKVTNLHQLKECSQVNIETDLMAKYVEKMMKN